MQRRHEVRALAAVLALAAATAHAGATDFGLRLDVEPAFALSQPQASLFGPGVGLTGTVLLEPAAFVDAQLSLGWLMLTEKAGSGLGRGGTVFGVGLGARLKRPMRRARAVPYLELAGSLAMTGAANFQLQPAVGVLFRFSDDSPIWLGLNARLSQVFKLVGPVPNFESYDASLFSVGLSLEFHTGGVPKDRDGDGVLDENDVCPDEAGKGEDGCELKPPPPPPLVKADSDGDGVLDDVDRCPKEAEDKDGFEDQDGCPDADNDKDGVPDVTDLCPELAGPLDAKGCPDSDGDGVPDKTDPCPKVKGTKENGGCPTYREVVVTESKIEIKQKVFFAFGTTTILPKSEGLLNEVVQALSDRTAVCVRVEGHTDSKGNSDENMRLSQGRANAVRDYLGAHGIKSERLRSKGYGSMLPRDSNGTAEGRDNNRRVEFAIVSCEEETL